MSITARLTELEAVNLILRSAGLPTTLSLPPDPETDAEAAYTDLQEAAQRLNAIGWSWNYEYDVTLELDGASPNTITVDSDVTQIRASRGWGYRRLVLRGDTLYDLENNSDQFTASVTVDLVRLLTWDLMPDLARWYSAYAGSEAFLMRTFPGSDEINRVRAEKESIWARLLHLESEMGDHNVHRNPDVFDAFHRPVHRGGTIIY